MNENKIIKKAYPQYMLLPALLIFIVFVMVPNITSFYYAFTNWNAMSDNIKFVGFENFKEVFDSTSGIGLVFINSGIFAICTTVLKILIGLILALLLNEQIRTKNALRAIFFLPMMLATVLLGIMFSEIYRPDGILNSGLSLIGLGFLQQDWITNTKLAIWSCSLVEVWRASGFAMAIFLAALQMIPKEIYEAVDIDGAGKFKKLLHITLPYLYQSIVLNIVLGIISGLKVFDLIYLITNGGPGRATEVLNITVLNEFSKGVYGYSTLLGLILFVIITVLYFSMDAIFSKFEVDVS